jgi:hypothetical protein
MMQMPAPATIARSLVLAAALAFAPVVPSEAAEQPKTIGTLATTATVTAEVQSIDLPTRTVVLKQEDGQSVTLKVDQRARNLPQVRVGDLVSVDYLERLAVRLHKPGAAAQPGAAVVQNVARTPLGEKPGGVVATQVTVVAPVVAIDKAKSLVTLRGVEGNLVEHKVRDARLLDGVEVGDNVELTYTEAVAIAVRPATSSELNRKELGRIQRTQ